MKQILLIDDDPLEYMYVSYLVKDRYGEGCKLGHVQDMTNAKEYLSNNRVDLILLDDRLEGGLTSVDTIPQLQRMAFNVPVIVISKNASSRHLETIAKLNGNAVIDKFELRKALSDGVLD